MYSSLVLFGAEIKGLATNLPKVDAAHANIATIFNAIYLVVGILAVVFIIIGGIRYTIAAGDSSKVAQAKSTITYAVVGLVVALLAFAITNYLLNSVKVNTWQSLRDSIINTLIYVAGTVSVVVLVFGGFRYVTAGGDSAAVGKAKNTVAGAVIGLVVSILAFAIVNFVLGNI